MKLKQIDRLIAEHVMGWTLIYYETGESADCDEDYEHAAYNDGWCWSGASTQEAWEFAPSSKIEDAWCVIEKLSSNQLRVDIRVAPGNDGWTSTMISDRDGNWWPAIEHLSAPLAICLASLRTVHIKINDVDVELS